MKNIIINIVSGKGGTGKTLLTAVLADMLGSAGKEVLCIDMDIFVRGLTALLYFYRQEASTLIEPPQMPTAAFLTRNQGDTLDKLNRLQGRLGICRYRSFNVLPAVSRIDENLAHREIIPDTWDEAKSIIQTIIRKVPDNFQIILLDSRAGFDELIAATHAVSDITICVEEEDAIAKITTDSVVAQLQKESNTPLFRLVNKARGIKTVHDAVRRGVGVSELGAIPFDIDVMNSFGSPSFWDDIAKSLYKASLAKAWNRLSTKMQLDCNLTVGRISPIGNERVEERLGLLTWRDRVLFIYGILLAITGFGVGLSDYDIIRRLILNPVQLGALLAGIIGLTLSLYVITRLGVGPRRRRPAKEDNEVS